MFFEKQQIDKPYKNIFKEMYYESRPQLNYHGTPYTFNTFDDGKFLTGEGFAAHGPGHYSADYIGTADKYNPGEYHSYEIASKWDNKPVRFNPKYKLDNGFIADKYDIVEYLRRALKEERPIVDAYLTKSMVDQVPKARHILENLNSFKEIKERHVGNTYKVNVPNEYFMWKERTPLEFQSDFVRRAMQNRTPIDYTKYLSKYPDRTSSLLYKINNSKIQKLADLVEDRSSFLKPKHLNLISERINRLPIETQYELLDHMIDKKPEFTSLKEDIQKLLGKENGVKGVRAIGHEDGPINITFSQDNIKMANTPWQRFKNRIPFNSLGTLANKIISSPWFRTANEYVMPASVGLDYLKPLDIIMSKGKEKQQKLQEMFEDAGYEVEIQPDGTYLFKGRI